MRGRYGPGSEAVRALCGAFGVSRSTFWAQGEQIVKERRRKEAERRRSEEAAQFEAHRSASEIAEALLGLEPERRDEVIRIVLSRT